MKKLTYLLVASVFLGAHILAIDIGIAKVSLYRIMLITIFGLGTLLMFQNHSILESTFQRQRLQYRLIYLFWLFSAVISILWVSDVSRWVNGIFFVGSGVFSIFIISSFAQTESDIKRLFLIVFLMIVLHQLIGIYEIMTNHYIWARLSSNRADQFATSWTNRLPYSTFANINDYSTVIFAIIPFSCIFFKLSKRNWLKLTSIFSILATILLLSRTGSRGNQLAFIVFTLTIVCLKVLNRRVITYLVYATLTLSSVGIIVFFAFSSVRQAIYGELQAFISHGGSNLYRINMIINGFIYFLKHFGLGVGAGNVEYWLTHYPVFEVDAPNIHNWFMDILTGYGLITFTLYIIMYIYILRQLYVSHKYSKNPFVKTSSLYLFAYVVSFIFSSLSSASNIIIEWQWVYWGVIIAYVQYTETAESNIINENCMNYGRTNIPNKTIHSLY